MPTGEAEPLAAGVASGERRAIARAISIAEAGGSEARALLGALYPRTGRATTVGVTGPPGAGKSTLLAALVRELRSAGRTVGVIACDPSSPLTGGAVLGDRIRLAEHALDEGVFVRSLATRGREGGLAEATLAAVLVLDAAGTDWVLVETVGAGQTDVRVRNVATTVVLVLGPGSGDSIQALKAGILEIPDVLCVNKRDDPGAAPLVRELRAMLALRPEPEDGWTPPIVATEALTGSGTQDLLAAIEAHGAHLAERGAGARRRDAGIEREVLAIAAAQAQRELARAAAEDAGVEGLLAAVRARTLDPLSAAEAILERVLARGSGAP